MITKNPGILISSATGEACQVVRSYIISREVDSLTQNFDTELEILKKKYDFDLDVENYPLQIL
jgi:hypothetical protein